MQHYRHKSNFEDQPNSVGQSESYQANDLDPANQQSKPKEKNSFWGYALTASISIFLTAVIILAVFFSINGGSLFPKKQSDLDFLKNRDTRLKENASPTNDLEPDDSKDSNLGLYFKDSDSNKEALQKLDVVLNLIEDNYFEELAENELIEAMTIGMVEKLGSPYTFYLSPEYVLQMEDSMSGEYSGIGAIVEKIGNIYQISDLIEDSPAESSGLMINDLFLTVDGRDAEEYEDVTALAMDIRGEEGTSVEISIFRPSENKQYDFTIERRSISNANIRSRMLTNNVGYVRITEFNEGVSDNFIAAMDQLQTQGAKNVVFDLRNNGGGYVHEVLTMLDYLLPEGTMITEIGRRDGEKFEIAEESDKYMGVPEDMEYICLINGNSASASELFAGCLRDWEKAELVGETSFGKGVGTITKFLTDGSAVQITNFYYNLPNGDNINELGLEPDYFIELPEEVRNFVVSRIEAEDDTQLQKAIEILKNK
ncbi:MAG TPA: S41 family peptidase [Candidatus Eisenbacteria bacterium]|nr:S41 family peptidase [Candidatus Eisenbacteria bacterium]